MGQIADPGRVLQVFSWRGETVFSNPQGRFSVKEASDTLVTASWTKLSFGSNFLGKPEQQDFHSVEITDSRSNARLLRFETIFMAVLHEFWGFRQTPP